MPIANAFLTIPAGMAFAKCVPHSVESLMIGSLNSMMKFNSEILARLWGLFFLYFSQLQYGEVTIEDYAALPMAIINSAF